MAGLVSCYIKAGARLLVNIMFLKIAKTASNSSHTFQSPEEKMLSGRSFLGNEPCRLGAVCVILRRYPLSVWNWEARGNGVCNPGTSVNSGFVWSRAGEPRWWESCVCFCGCCLCLGILSISPKCVTKTQHPSRLRLLNSGAKNRIKQRLRPVARDLGLNVSTAQLFGDTDVTDVKAVDVFPVSMLPSS